MGILHHLPVPGAAARPHVLEDGVLSTLDSLIDWEHQGFALAEGWDGQNYSGLVLPTDSASRPATVDALLLVDPLRAEQQRQREIQARPPEPVPTPGPGPGPHEPGGQPPGGGEPPPLPPRPLKTRFLAPPPLNPDFYARDFGRITSEVIQHLAAVEGVELEVRLEISAVAKDGVRRGQSPTHQRKRPDTQVRPVRF